MLSIIDLFTAMFHHNFVMIIFHFINSRLNFRELLLYCVMSTDQAWVRQEGSFIVRLPELWLAVFPSPTVPSQPDFAKIEETTCEVLHEDHLIDSKIEYTYRIYSIKAGVHVNRSEIWSTIKRKSLELKWVGNTTRKFTIPNASPRLIGDCLVSVY